MIPCAVCETPFEPRNAVHRYCSTRCRHRARRLPDPTPDQFDWDPIRAAQTVKPRIVRHRVPSPQSPPKGWERTVVLPDPQFGYWRDPQDRLHPVHDEHALAVARQITALSGATGVVWLGDMLDFPEFSKYQQTAAFVLTAQAAIDRCHAELAYYHALGLNQTILSGNHDERLHKAIATNLLAAAGIRKAADPDAWPALSVPSLLRLDELGITYIGAHPAGAHWINDNLVCVHGRWIGSRTQRAVNKALDEERVSIIFGHTHRLEMAVRTRSLRTRPAYNAAWAAGCLCRIDGTVPSVRGGYRAGQRGPVKAWEDWQQGLLVVTYRPGNGPFHVEPVLIIENQPAHWRDHTVPGALDTGP